MLRFLTRLTGFLLLAAGFVALVADGTRSIVAGALRFSSIADSLNQFAPGRLAQAQMALTSLHPALWDPAAIWLLGAPTGVALSFVGLALMWLGRAPREPIGYATR